MTLTQLCNCKIFMRFFHVWIKRFLRLYVKRTRIIYEKNLERGLGWIDRESIEGLEDDFFEYCNMIEKSCKNNSKMYSAGFERNLLNDKFSLESKISLHSSDSTSKFTIQLLYDALNQKSLSNDLQPACFSLTSWKSRILMSDKQQTTHFQLYNLQDRPNSSYTQKAMN